MSFKLRSFIDIVCLMYTIFAIIFIHVPGSLFLFLSVKYFSALPCYTNIFLCYIFSQLWKNKL